MVTFRAMALPARIRRLFWDVHAGDVSLERHRDFIIGRVLAEGGWNDVRWLRRRLGDDAIREWLVRRRGRGISNRQLSFWQIALDLPRKRVSEWLSSEGRENWGKQD